MTAGRLHEISGVALTAIGISELVWALDFSDAATIVSALSSLICGFICLGDGHMMIHSTAELPRTIAEVLRTMALLIIVEIVAMSIVFGMADVDAALMLGIMFISIGSGLAEYIAATEVLTRQPLSIFRYSTVVTLLLLQVPIVLIFFMITLTEFEADDLLELLDEICYLILFIFVAIGIMTERIRSTMRKGGCPPAE